MKWILLCLLFVLDHSFAEELLKGEGKFTSKNGDGHEFVRKQLIFEGTKDIISKELERLNLNKDVFWQKYNEALNERLIEIDKNYKEIKKYDEITNEGLKSHIIDTIRVKQLTFRRTYLGLDKLMKKFSIRKISRSQRDPNYRYIKIEGVIDSSMLTKTYYNLVRGKKTSEYGNLYVRSKFNLEGITYSELGIDNDKEIKNEVTRNWLEWFIKNKPLNIANIEVLSESKEENFEKLVKSSYERYKQDIPEYFVNSLLLDIELNIVKEKYDDNLKEIVFIYSGNAYLKDIQTNMTVGTYEFPEEKKSYIKSEGINIANLLANHVYQMAKTSFPKVQHNIKNITPISIVQALNLKQFQNINQVYDFLELAETKGVKYSLKTKLESFSQEEARAMVYFDGDVKDLKELLGQLQAAKKDLSFEVIDRDDQIGIKFNKVVEHI